MIIHFLLMTLMFDSVVILWGEANSWSLFWVEGLIIKSKMMQSYFSKSKSLNKSRANRAGRVICVLLLLTSMTFHSIHCL